MFCHRIARRQFMNSSHVIGHQAFHPFHFGPRPFPFGHPQDPLGFKLSGKSVLSSQRHTRGLHHLRRDEFARVPGSGEAHLQASRHVSPSIDN